MNTRKNIKAAVRYLVLIAIFIGAFLLIKWFYDSLETTAYEPPVTPVETIMAEERTVEKTITLSSSVSARDIVTVTPYVDGTILEFCFKEGDEVKEGDVVAKIDPEPYKLQYEQAKAAYIGYASSYERVKQLYDEGIATKQDYDSVKAQNDAYSAQLDLAALQLSYTDVTAHASGTIQKKLASQGSAASKGTPIAVITDLNDLIVNVDISEKYYGIFEHPENVKVYIQRPESQYTSEAESTATITNIAKYIDPSSKYFTIELSIDDCTAFLPGMYVKVRIVYESKDGYALPKSAVRLDGSAYYIEDGRAVYADLSNEYSNDDYVIVPDSLKDRMFISNGKETVLSGEKVRVLGEDE